MNIQVLFGSQNDERVFKPLVDSLNPLGAVHMKVASAHRDPALVKQIVTSDEADVFVAGAGLAAHLPGVVASLTKKCVYGVAVNGAFGGLDAFLAIVQMPKDIPVMCVTENNLNQISAYLKRVENFDFKNLHLNWNHEVKNDLVAEAIQQIEKECGMAVVWCEVTDEKCMGKILTEDDHIPCEGLNVLLFSTKDKNSSERALDFFKWAQQGGAWVGLNNIKNFSLQLLKLKELNHQIKRRHMN